MLGRGLYEVPLARLSFRYGPVTLPRSLRPLPRHHRAGRQLYEVVRDCAAEVDAIWPN